MCTQHPLSSVVRTQYNCDNPFATGGVWERTRRARTESVLCSHKASLHSCLCADTEIQIDIDDIDNIDDRDIET